MRRFVTITVQKLWANQCRALGNSRGSVDLLLILFVFFFCVALAFPFSSVFITYSNLTSMSKLVVEDVEFRGMVDQETSVMIRRHLVNFNLDDKNPTFKFSGAILPDGKIQLHDEFIFEIHLTEHLKFANLMDRPIQIDIPIHKKISGVSQNYYRNSEL